MDVVFNKGLNGVIALTVDVYFFPNFSLIKSQNIFSDTRSRLQGLVMPIKSVCENMGTGFSNLEILQEPEYLVKIS